MDEDNTEDRLADRLRVTKMFPPIRVFSGIAVILVLVFAIGRPFMGLFQSQVILAAGEMAQHHHMIEADCSRCHELPFVEVKDEACLSCHNMTDHATKLDEIYADHPDLNFRCADCHLEHNGTHEFTISDSGLCVQCHARLVSQYHESIVGNVVSFDQHPNFGLPEDISGIKLNHALHLDPEGIPGPDRMVVMKCGDCHQLTEDLKHIVPITFEKDCASCHPLTFDDRLPDTEVPHGDPDIVYNFMYAEYAKLYLADQEELEVAEFDIRRKPGYQSKQETYKARAFARELIVGDARYAEEDLFTRTACQLCHEVSPKQEIDVQSQYSRYNVVPAEIPERWMPMSLFDHGAHEEIQCEECHGQVRGSDRTSDVLVPFVGTCKECHHDGPHEPGKVRSDCIMCHSYHDPKQLERKQTIMELVK